MAGQAQRGSRDHGRSSRLGSAVALVGAASAAGAGSDNTTTTASPAPAVTPAEAPGPSPRAIWRLLQMKGMTPDEAANLTAFLYGLPTTDLRWSLLQLNQLLFLRQMRQSGHFGCTDGGLTSGA
jgi:hypothetical protein